MKGNAQYFTTASHQDVNMLYCQMEGMWQWVWLILWCYSRSFLMNQQETMQISAKTAKTQSQELNFELLKTLRDSQ